MPNSSSPTSDPLTPQMTELEDRLCREFAPVDGPAADVVRGHVRQVRAAFGSPRVMTFLPMLIERAVRRCLRDDRRAQTEAQAQGRTWSPPSPATVVKGAAAAREAPHVPPTTHLIELEERLCREFAPAGGSAAEDVRNQVRAARAGFGTPKLLSFLPVLVEHDVRGQLRRTASIERSTPCPGPTSSARPAGPSTD